VAFGSPAFATAPQVFDGVVYTKTLVGLPAPAFLLAGCARAIDPSKECATGDSNISAELDVGYLACGDAVADGFISASGNLRSFSYFEGDGGIICVDLWHWCSLRFENIPQKNIMSKHMSIHDMFWI
jgi:hypothetical protein